MNTKEILKDFQNQLKEMNRYGHMMGVISYDMETSAPILAMEEHAKDLTELSQSYFKILKSKKFENNLIYLNKHKDELDYLDKKVIERYYESYLESKKITPFLQRKFSEIENNAYSTWLQAKENKDYSLFKPVLKELVNISKKKVNLSMLPKKATTYDYILDRFEKGNSVEMLDKFFNELKEGIIPLLQKIQKSKKKIRTDFLTRYVPHYKQIEFGKYCLSLIGYDFSRGALGETEHPFTTSISYNDHRVTTNVDEYNFISNIYSLIHEGGHAIFGQSIPKEMYEHFIDYGRSAAMDESTSRFFENIIGRSKEFIHLIYPKFHELFNEELGDVSEKELYEGINLVKPDFLRTEADEVTYSLHVIIRYELEKKMFNEKVNFNSFNKEWNRLYKEYLNLKVKNDKEGILQDSHWSGTGFGYFPTYSEGNAYNAMYFERMSKEIDVKNLILSNNIKEIVSWMKENVFKKASYLDPKDWIKDICGKELSAKPYIDYLNKKYKEIYEIKD